MSKNLSELSGRKGIVENLFEKMGKAAADNDGTPSLQELEKLADEFLMGDANTYGTITAYDFMKPENKGKKAYYCNGTACICAGTQENVQEQLAKHYDVSEIGHMTCLGRCHENSSFHIDGVNYSGNAIDKLEDIVDLEDGINNEDEYNVEALGPEILTKAFDGIDAFQSLLKEMLFRKREDVLEQIKIANVRGRGGAGFPMGIKWEGCLNEENEDKFIICNADEGDPGAYSDRYLLEKQPYLVLFGMMIAGFCTKAKWGIIYIRAEYPESVEIVQKAINALKSEDLLGKNILNSGFDFEFKIIQAKGAYICGEETALINSIEGQRPEVRTRPPYPTVRGLFNKPTIVNNVETLATVYWILKNGGIVYKSLGTEKSTGTKLISLDSYFNKPGMYEVEMGTPLSDVVYKLGGGFKSDVKALHIGGPLGGIVPVSMIDVLNVDFESFSNAGFLLGHASVVSIPADFPMINYLEHLFDFAAFESCGKCFPCRLGTKRAHEMLSSAAAFESRIERTLFDDLLDTLEQGSLCAHGGGIPLPARNALMYFADELDTHFAN